MAESSTSSSGESRDSKTPASRLDETLVPDVATPGGEPGPDPESTLFASTRAVSGDTPSRIGDYRILRVIGEGGMGTVYEAEQKRPRRIVALKMIKPGLATAPLLRRFEQESQVLGRLQHPGIAQIYESGTADAGRGVQPYLAMEFVRGRTLDEYVEEKRIGIHGRLDLVARICDAVEHAHQKGIIHRDLKPGNILVDESGQPKILDFGLARVMDTDVQLTMHTDVGQILGTLPYMSPEQVAGDPAQLDARSDVYTLGVILYQLLAGRLPYDVKKKQLPEGMRIIREEDPSRLSTVSRTLRGDVETIAAKALSKEKERRYQSAADLASDIRRHLKHEPIVARPSSTAYRLGKFARRHKALVGGLVAVFVVLMIGVVVSSWQAVRATRAEGLATSRLAETQAVNAFLQDMLSSVDPANMKGRDVTVRQVLDEAAKKVGDGSLKDQPEIDASIRMTLGNTYRNLGLFPEAEPHLRAALEIRRTLSNGQDDAPVAESTKYLALLMLDQGEWAGAEPLFREAIRLRRQALGDDHPDVAVDLNNLAVVLDELGDLEGPEPLYREALRIQRKALGDEHPSVAESLHNLAGLLKGRDDLAGADSLYREALRIQRKVLGEEHPDVALTLNNLAVVRRARGDSPGAATFYREAIRIQRKVLGEEHPDAAMSMHNLAVMLAAEGEYADAEALYREAIRIQRKALGDESAEVGRSLNNFAVLLSDLGDSVEAETLFRDALRIRRKALGDEHPDVATSQNGLAAFHAARGDLSEAQPLYRAALEIRRRTFGDGHPSVAVVLNNQGALLVDKGELALAEPVLREALTIRTERLPARHVDLAATQANLALCLIRHDRPAEAESLLREALSIREEKAPPNHWSLPNTRSLLGEALARQKNFEAAEPLLLQGYEGMKDNKAAPAVRKREAGERIERLYASWGRPEKAAAWRASLPASSPSASAAKY